MFFSIWTPLALASILSGSIYAAPTSVVEERTPGSRTLPLKRINLVRDGEHNVIAHQRHRNSAMRRHASMFGYEGPSDSELRKRMLKRAGAVQVDREEGGDLQRRKFFEGALDKAHELNAAGTTGDSNFHPLGPPARKRTFFTGALDKDNQLNALGAIEGSTFQPLGPAVGAKRSSVARQLAGTTTKVTGNNNGGFSKAVLAAAQAVPQPVVNTGTALSTQGISYAIEGNDIGYLANFTFGTPAKDFLMLVDTGSADTWVPSTACTACGPHNQLGKIVSSTFVASNTPWSITYGSGSASGVLCADTISVAGMQLANHAFGVTTQESRQFSSADVPFDGLVGTAQSTLSNQKVLTIPESLVKTGLLTTPVISYALGRIGDGVNDGELTIGGTNKALADSATTQVLPVSGNTGFWATAMAAVSVDGKTAVTGRTAILDTGTSLIFGPQADTDALHALIPGSQTDGQGTYTVPCTTNAVITMTFGTVNYAIDPRDLTFLPVNNAALSGNCISSISGGNIGGPGTWLVGDSFLKNVMFETDIAANTITLAGRMPASRTALQATKVVADQPAQAEPLKAANEAGLKGVGVIGAAAANVTEASASAISSVEVNGTTSKASSAAATTTGEATTSASQAAAAATSGKSSSAVRRSAASMTFAGAISSLLLLLAAV